MAVPFDMPIARMCVCLDFDLLTWESQISLVTS